MGICIGCRKNDAQIDAKNGLSVVVAERLGPLEAGIVVMGGGE